MIAWAVSRELRAQESHSDKLIVHTIGSELARQAGGGDDVAGTDIEPGAF
jgi:hypothetical protein